MTFRRENLKKGLEPDQSYFIRHAADFLGTETDLETDPPPDLVLEVDVTSPSDLKLPVYAAMKVPEVWIWKADRLQPLVLRDGQICGSDGKLGIARIPAGRRLEDLDGPLVCRPEGDPPRVPGLRAETDCVMWPSVRVVKATCPFPIAGGSLSTIATSVCAISPGPTQ